MNNLITGIQQVGIGVDNAEDAWNWYRKQFGVDVLVFDDEAEAALMKLYTGGITQKRRAILALNLMGGGGFEIWQFKSRKPENLGFNQKLGDLGINAVKIKSPDVEQAHKLYSENEIAKVSPIFREGNDRKMFWLFDPYGNRFQVVEGNTWFSKSRHITGGVSGVTIGVSDIDKALPLYRDVLGFETTVYDKTGRFSDFDSEKSFRRVLLHKSQKDVGPFSRLFGEVEVELIQAKEDKPRKLFENRYWGDPGFIHVCFDVNDMDALKTACNTHGYRFTVDSANSFDMGEAAGRFSYIEDPDGTLIEFVQTHKVPVMKKWGWYINLKNRTHSRPLPNWMLRSLALNRVKD